MKVGSLLFLVVTWAMFLAEETCDALSTSSDASASRRRVLEQASQAAFALGGSLLIPQVAVAEGEPVAAAASVIGKTVPKDKAVLVLGANGQTGRECVAFALASGRPCVASSRSGKFNDFDQLNKDNKLTTAALDVSDAQSMQSVIAKTPNLGAVIFAASASTKRDVDPFAVDKNGVIYAAQACIAAQIPRLVIVSSGTVTRPDAAVYKLLNTVGNGIMEAKIQGEDEVRALYADPVVRQQNLGYSIVRPGGLTKGESLGPTALELNQGDNKSGRLSRADVAAICVNALDSQATWDRTFECYETLTAKPIESVGLSNILKLKGESTFVSGKERTGTTWEGLFNGLELDA